jgi:hypothetical protein
MGHTHCGGVRAWPTVGDFIDNWMFLIGLAAKTVQETGDFARPDYLGRLERASLRPWTI